MNEPFAEIFDARSSRLKLATAMAAAAAIDTTSVKNRGRNREISGFPDMAVFSPTRRAVMNR
ncbi:MAG TPA: hypothetical protein VGX78_21180 [Pirellulales bacterium]|nr:hypothetical protein [Pirellulales bacterium]